MNFSHEKLMEKAITIKQFFDTQYIVYSHYRAKQRIPNMDGFIETQRKIIWTVLQKPIKEKIRVADVQSVVTKFTDYNHSDGSLISTIANMVTIAGNNVTYLRDDGTYGTKTDPDCGEPRYVKTRNKSILSVMFNKDDVSSYKYVISNNKKVEPETLFPIIPQTLINGQMQIGTGFSCKILPRNPLDVIDLYRKMLTGQLKTYPSQQEFAPYFPMFSGDVEYQGDGRWSIKGKVSKYQKGNKKRIIITEAPPNKSLAKYLEVLHELKEPKTKGKDGKPLKKVKPKLINDYKDSSNANKWHIEINSPQLWDKDEDELLEILGLVWNVKENFTVFNENFDFQRKENIFEYVTMLVQSRMKIYHERKQYLINKINFQLIKARAIVNYIDYYNSGKIILQNKSEEEVIAQLDSFNKQETSFYRMTKTFSHEYNPYQHPDSNYDYLLDLPNRKLTSTHRNKLVEDYNKLVEEVNVIQQKPVVNFWLEDLDAVEKECKKEFEIRRKAIENNK